MYVKLALIMVTTYCRYKTAQSDTPCALSHYIKPCTELQVAYIFCKKSIFNYDVIEDGY